MQVATRLRNRSQAPSGLGRPDALGSTPVRQLWGSRTGPSPATFTFVRIYVCGRPADRGKPHDTWKVVS